MDGCSFVARFAITLISFIRLVVGCSDNKLYVFTPSFDASQTLQLPGTPSYVQYVPTNKVLVCHGSSVTLWSMETMSVLHTLNASGSTVRYAEFLPEGKIVTGSYDNHARIYNAETGQVISTYSGHNSDINCLCVLPDGKVATGSDDNTVRVWNSDDLATVRTLTGHSSRVWTLTPVGEDRVASGGNDNRVMLWNFRTGQQLWSHQMPNTVHGLAVLNDTHLLATCSNQMVALDLATGQVVHTHPSSNNVSVNGVRVLGKSVPFAGWELCASPEGPEFTLCINQARMKTAIIPAHKAKARLESGRWYRLGVELRSTVNPVTTSCHVYVDGMLIAEKQLDPTKTFTGGITNEILVGFPRRGTCVPSCLRTHA
jgi:WD40 repeat protein